MSDNKIFAIRNGARQGIKRTAAMKYFLQRALWVLNVRMLHENKKMEVIK